MRKRKNRVSIWVILIVILVGIASYFYLSKSNQIADIFNKNGNSRPSELIFISQNKDEQKLIKHNLDTNTNSTLLSSKDHGQIISLSKSNQPETAYLISLKDSKYLLSSADLATGNTEQLADLTAFIPYKLFHLANNRLALIAGDKRNSLILLNNDFQKITEYINNNEITSIFETNQNLIELSDFDGSQSKIKSYNPDNNEIKEIATFNGHIYNFSDSSTLKKVLYAKKININEQNPNNPAGSTYWKIVIQDWPSLKETELSEGNFDQDAITDDNFTLFAYQKKFDTNDQTDGRIFIVDSTSKIDRLDIGTPLIFK